MGGLSNKDKYRGLLRLFSSLSLSKCNNFV